MPYEKIVELPFEDALMKLEAEYKEAGLDLESMISGYELRKMALEEELDEAPDDEE